MIHDIDHSDQTELEQATSRSLPAGFVLNPDRTSERDGFLALGAALESAAGKFKENALIAQLKQLPGEKSRLNSVAVPIALPLRRTADATWQTALGVALAAAALFALARIAIHSPSLQQRNDPLLAQHEPPPPANANRTTDVEPTPAARTAWSNPAWSNPAWSNPVWLDPLDEELAFAQAAFENLSAGEAGVDGSLSRMNDRLEALSQELYGGSL